MSWTLEKDFRFEASHQLPHHDGKCQRLHGHSWLGTVFVEVNYLETVGPKQGMGVDYGDIKSAVERVVNQLDHHHLNDRFENPTSEIIAHWVYEQVELALWGESRTTSEMRWRCVGVRIEETCTARVTYRPR